MPPHFHGHAHGGHHRGYGGGRRSHGHDVVYLDVVPDAVYCDGSIVNGICIPDREASGSLFEGVRGGASRLPRAARVRAPEASGVLPTFVTPDDARRYIDEVDSGYRRLDTAIAASVAAPADFKVSWGIQMTTWTAFSIPAKATVGWLNTTAVMDQTDRFNEQLKNWFAGFQAVGGSPPGPPPTTPGQGVPGTTNTTADMTKLVTAVGITAAMILVVPKMLSFFK